MVIYRGPAYKYKPIKEQDHVSVIPESDKLLQKKKGGKKRVLIIRRTMF
jgi:hypothetical protein